MIGNLLSFQRPSADVLSIKVENDVASLFIKVVKLAA